MEQLIHRNATRGSILNSLTIILVSCCTWIAELEATRALLQWQAEVSFSAAIQTLTTQEGAWLAGLAETPYTGGSATTIGIPATDHVAALSLTACVVTENGASLTRLICAAKSDPAALIRLTDAEPIALTMTVAGFTKHTVTLCTGLATAVLDGAFFGAAAEVVPADALHRLAQFDSVALIRLGAFSDADLTTILHRLASITSGAMIVDRTATVRTNFADTAITDSSNRVLPIPKRTLLVARAGDCRDFRTVTGIANFAVLAGTIGTATDSIIRNALADIATVDAANLTHRTAISVPSAPVDTGVLFADFASVTASIRLATVVVAAVVGAVAGVGTCIVAAIVVGVDRHTGQEQTSDGGDCTDFHHLHECVSFSKAKEGISNQFYCQQRPMLDSTSPCVSADRVWQLVPLGH